MRPHGIKIQIYDVAFRRKVFWVRVISGLASIYLAWGAIQGFRQLEKAERIAKNAVQVNAQVYRIDYSRRSVYPMIYFDYTYQGRAYRGADTVYLFSRSYLPSSTASLLVNANNPKEAMVPGSVFAGPGGYFVPVLFALMSLLFGIVSIKRDSL